MSGLFKFLGLFVCAAAVVVGVNYTAASIFEPVYPEQPAYAVEGVAGMGSKSAGGRSGQLADQWSQSRQAGFFAQPYAGDAAG